MSSIFVPVDLVCPFCKEGEFDVIGLKAHLLNGWCEKFNNVISLEEERKQLGIKEPEEESEDDRPISSGPLDAGDIGMNDWLNEDFTR